jgi:hypothetical protein
VSIQRKWYVALSNALLLLGTHVATARCKKSSASWKLNLCGFLVCLCAENDCLLTWLLVPFPDRSSPEQAGICPLLTMFSFHILMLHTGRGLLEKTDFLFLMQNLQTLLQTQLSNKTTKKAVSSTCVRQFSTCHVNLYWSMAALLLTAI